MQLITRDILDQNGLLKQLSKQLIERSLQAELTDLGVDSDLCLDIWRRLPPIYSIISFSGELAPNIYHMLVFVGNSRFLPKIRDWFCVRCSGAPRQAKNQSGASWIRQVGLDNLAEPA